MIKKIFSGKGGIFQLISVALPMIISQASFTIMMFTDRIFLSHIDDLHMSAAMIGGLTAFLFMTLWVGIIDYISALVAQHYGAKKYDGCSLAVTQGVILSFISYPIILACIPLGKVIFSMAHHDPRQLELESTYFMIIAVLSLGCLLKSAFSGFFIGCGRMRTVMAADIAGMFFNIPCNFILIFGGLGIPAMGIRGAAYGSAIAEGLTLTILIIMYFRKENRAKYNVIKNIRFDSVMFKKMMRFGFPAGMTLFLTAAAFNAIMQQFHSYGSDVAAAVTIVTSWDMLAFLPMYGLAVAIKSIVGRHMGAGNSKSAQRAVYSGIALAFVYDIVVALFFIFSTKHLVSLFLTAEEMVSKPVIVETSITMLRLAVLYIFFESVYLCLSEALSSAGDTRSVMRITVWSHCFFSFVVIALVQFFAASPYVVWMGCVCLPIAMCFFITRRFLRGKWKEIDVVSAV